MGGWVVLVLDFGAFLGEFVFCGVVVIYIYVMRGWRRFCWVWVCCRVWWLRLLVLLGVWVASWFWWVCAVGLWFVLVVCGLCCGFALAFGYVWVRLVLDFVG